MGFNIKLPKGQRTEELLLDVTGKLVRVIASDAHREKWYLYDVSDSGELTKIETGKSPLFSKLGRK